MRTARSRSSSSRTRRRGNRIRGRAFVALILSLLETLLATRARRCRRTLSAFLRRVGVRPAGCRHPSPKSLRSLTRCFRAANRRALRSMGAIGGRRGLRGFLLAGGVQGVPAGGCAGGTCQTFSQSSLPDGSLVVFVSGGNGGCAASGRLLVTSGAGKAPRELLSASVVASEPHFSPDSTRVLPSRLQQPVWRSGGSDRDT